MSLQSEGEKGISIILEETKSNEKELEKELPFSSQVSFEQVENIPQEYSTHAGNNYLRRRTTIRGVTSMKKEKSEYYDLERKMSDKTYKKSFFQRIDWIILRVCVALIKVVDSVVPSRFNPREMESDDTVYGRKLRETLLDRGKNTRRLIALVFFLMLVFGITFFMVSTPWKSYFASDVIAEYTTPANHSPFTGDGANNNHPTATIRNVLMPRYMNPQKDPSDVIRIKNMVRQQNVFKKIAIDDIKRGYIETFVEYPHGVNISFELVEKIMLDEAKNRDLGCLCAAHVGIPLNIIWTYRKGFYHEPKMTLGTPRVGVMGPIKNTNLYYNASIATKRWLSSMGGNHHNNNNNNIDDSSYQAPPQEGFYVTYPYGIALRYVTRDGLKSDEVYGKGAGCVVFCCELAAKKPLVGGYDQGGVLLSSDGNTKKFGIL